MPPLEKDVVTASPPSATGKRFETIVSLIDADLNAKREEYLFEAPGFVKRWAENAIRDKRDMPMVHLIFNLCCLIPVLMTSFFVSNTWLGFGLYLATFATFQARFLLLLHYSSHRPLFKAQYSLLNQFLPMVVCNFFGLPPGVYFLHHCVMHHIENNVFPWDVSSTEPYQRDNFLHFLFYW